MSSCQQIFNPGYFDWTLPMFYRITGHQNINIEYIIIYDWHNVRLHTTQMRYNGQSDTIEPNQWWIAQSSSSFECRLKVINIPCVCLDSVCVSLSYWSDAHLTQLLCVCAHVIWAHCLSIWMHLSSLCLLRAPLHLCIHHSTCCLPQWDRCLGMHH